MASNIRWADVVSLSPLRVQFAGDSAGVPVDRKLDGVTLAVGDRVALIEIAPRQWIIAGKVVAS